MTKIKYSPSKEQKTFIQNDNDFLIVSAGPGSGKTETIIEYLTKKIPNLKKEIVTCSFTRNSTNEIKNRFNNLNKDLNENISFQTFDSFLITRIWKYYFNRIAKYSISKFKIDINLDYKIEQKEIIYSKIKWKDFKLNYKNSSWLEKKVKDFINNYTKGILEIGFVSEYILLKFIIENEQIQKYISNTFERIIIDEAQDLSLLRYKILFQMYKIDVKITLVGDERQTIYEYLGAEKNIFELIKKKYSANEIKEIILNHNFRYKGINNVENKNIQKILLATDENDFKKNINIAIKNQNIETIENLEEWIQKNSKENTLFLTKKNDDVEKISNFLKKMKIEHRTTFKLPKELNISFEEQSFIENLFLYDLLAKGEISKKDIKSNIIDEICDFIWPFDFKSNDKFLKLFWNKEKNFDALVEEIIKITKIKNMDKVIDLFKKDVNYLSNLPQKNIQVMTFHGSKGLEAENVFINFMDIDNYLNSTYIRQSFIVPSFQEMYVAISRVKNKIYLLKH